jgi:hypothetical protein
MVLYTPLSGSWLNTAESLQRILSRRALAGHHPQTADEIIAWLEATAAAWNATPTPFTWGGKRAHAAAGRVSAATPSVARALGVPAYSAADLTPLSNTSDPLVLPLRLVV